MLDGFSTFTTIALASLAVVFALWTFFISKLIFLGKPRSVSVKAFGVEILVVPPGCKVCGSNGD